MGYDYTSIHVFSQRDGPLATRSEIIARLPLILSGRAVPPSEANRSVVVGPPSRWVFVGDSSSATEDGDPDALQKLIDGLSMIAPTLAIHMSDSACVHMYLRHHGRLIDKFGTGIFPFYSFRSDEEAAPFQGVVERWAPFTKDTSGPAALRAVWDSQEGAESVVRMTAEVLGIRPELAGCGFTVFDEAEEIHFREWLQDCSVLSEPFEEFHFVMAEEHG